ncbi:PQQ-dependent sugar dehydrogenase [Neolewinella lacunae]|uniref:PQQ-dependent sugar dehydrogenase n=1 Tax=Neolewinella lacunae TaxID=1517758 RepID=A0A923T7X9_9BACT|nr:glucose/sorbosone family PQQ-dependent dehydrogenase [Neolewinella lacunae]MBC6993986.1 PQQ-dependent sugar dehydrogenase [Neolewinella lacunae]MDN3635499.1 PQQ-dependent sugar dehydrogenase [Neolewinella lacunae]
MRFLPFFSWVFLALSPWSPSTVVAQTPSFTTTQVGTNNLVARASDLHYGPDDHLWVAERAAGRVVRIDPATAARTVLLTLPDIYSDASQDGLLSLALHDSFTLGKPFVYLSYTYQENNERRQRLARYTYQAPGSLTDPVTLLEDLPASNDHNSGRLVFGPDAKIYCTIGDQGNNQNRNFCAPIRSQDLPTQEEIDQENWINYPGKILRMNQDGSIPADNPLLNGVRSHVFTYGHRNAQGLAFGSNGLLYSDEHGPNTDDEVNIINGGKNYGWPRVVGFRDDQAYDYCNWSSAADCASLTYVNNGCPAGVPLQEESTLTDTNYQDPIFVMFAVPDDYDYDNPACQNAYTCRPNVAPSSLLVYESDAIPDWSNSLLITSLKRGKVYRLQLDASGTAIVGDTTEYFYTGNRYRDLVVAPDGKTFYAITDQSGNITDQSGLNLISGVRNPGAILKFSLTPPVSVAGRKVIHDLRIWPNPAQRECFVELRSSGETNVPAELINSKGQRIPIATAFQSGVNRVSLQHLPSGVYTLRLLTRQGFHYERVVVRGG